MNEDLSDIARAMYEADSEFSGAKSMGLAGTWEGDQHRQASYLYMALAAIAAWNRRAEPGWQPISSAPRDGTAFGPDPAWVEDLVSKVRMIARYATAGTTSLNGELASFRHILTVAANMIELWAPPATPAHAELSPGNSSDLRGEEG